MPFSGPRSPRAFPDTPLPLPLPPALPRSCVSGQTSITKVSLQVCRGTCTASDSFSIALYATVPSSNNPSGWASTAGGGTPLKIQTVPLTQSSATPQTPPACAVGSGTSAYRTYDFVYPLTSGTKYALVVSAIPGSTTCTFQLRSPNTGAANYGTPSYWAASLFRNGASWSPQTANSSIRVEFTTLAP